jgi:flotillin
MGNIITSSPNEAAIISGCGGTRIVIGGCGFQFWMIQKCDRLGLELMTLQVDSTSAETAKGVRISLSSTAQIKLMASKDDDGGGAIDLKRVEVAAQHFLGYSRHEIQNAVHRTMEGHQRQVIGTLTVEELYKDRASFSMRVKELVDPDLERMGFKLVSYTVKNIDDDEGYITALGATQTAAVKREAEEGMARNESQARVSVAKSHAEAEIAEAEAKRAAQVRANELAQSEAESKRDLDLKRQEYQKEVNEATAKAEAAIRIETAIQNQKVIKQQTLQKVEEATVMLQVTEREVERKKAEAEGESGARLLEQRNEAESKRVAAEAMAYEIKQIGEAEAGAVAAKGEAEAKVIREKVTAYPQYAQERITEIVMRELPGVAKEVAAPLKNAGKMIFVSGDGSGPSRLTTDIGNIMSALPDTVESLTGMDIKKVMKRLEGTKGGPKEAFVDATD